MYKEVAVIVTTVAIIAGGITAVVGYHEEREDRHRLLKTDVAGNSKWILIQEWRRLSEIRKNRRLTFNEYIRWCEAGVRLNIFKVCPPR